MQTAIAAVDFKAKCLKLLDQVAETREPLVITKHGKAVARLVPMPPEQTLVGAMAGSVVAEENIIGPLDDIIGPLDNDWSACQ